jgi:DNA-binding response OmpR family regulator
MGQARVLVVDDERFFREAITEVLGAQRLAWVTAATGAEALEQAADEGVGVVVLDLQLPDLHGLEVFRRLRAARPELRVIILSAHTDQESVLEALRLGAFDYLAKPLHEEELALAVKRALETFGLASGWSGLRVRLSRLESTLCELWERARSESARDDPQGLREAAVQAVAEVLGAARTSLVLVDEEAGALRVAAARGFKDPLECVEPVPLGQGVAGAALARAEPLLVADVEADDRYAGRAPADRYASRSFAVAPLVAGARALGVLCATERKGGLPFDEEDLALLRILSLQVAQMLDPERSARAAGAGEEPLAELGLAEHAGAQALGPAARAELARAICEAVTAEVEPGRILEAALRPVAEALDAAPVSLYLTDPTSGELRREAQCDAGRRSDRPALGRGRGLTGSVLEAGLLIASADPAADLRFDAAVDTPEDGRPGPLLCGPLRFRGKALGVFRAFPVAGGAAAPEVGELLASALSAAVRNVLLYRSLVETIEEVAAARRQAAR